MCLSMIFPIEKIRKDNSGRDKLGDWDGRTHTLLYITQITSRVFLYSTGNSAPYQVMRSVTQWCLTLGGPVDCILPGFSAHGISQARILGQVSFPSPGHLPYPGTRPASFASLAFAGRFFTPSATQEAHSVMTYMEKP